MGAGTEFEVNWTGPNASGDYVTIVALGVTAWTDESYFNTAGGSPGRARAPTETGDYELRYVSGADDSTMVRLPISVIPFETSLEAVHEVQAGSESKSPGPGPNGPSDYVTILPAGAEGWTDESYFTTAGGSPGRLVAPIAEGDYELRYITGADEATLASRPILVTPYVITLEAPTEVEAGSSFEVSWTEPNGPSDYITIVPAGSPEGTHRSYAYTASGSVARLTAPDEAGDYEIWYASDRVPGTFASMSIVVVD